MAEGAPVTLRVLCADEPVVVTLARTESVSALAHAVALRLRAAPEHVRLIYGGQWLQPHAILQAALRLSVDASEATVHAVLVERGPPVGPASPATSGLERLVEAGLSAADVDELRAQLARLYGAPPSRAWEERWLSDAVAREEAPRDSSTATVYDWVLLGALVGFVCPPAVLWGRQFPVHSRIGLLVGAVTSICFAAAHALFGGSL